MDEVTRKQKVREWHERNGGHYTGDPSPHALRMLAEAVELCVECGASIAEVSNVVSYALEREIDKQSFKQDKILDGEKIEEEMSDVQICLDVLEFRTGLNINAGASRKVSILLDRAWEADRHGVLWRPGRVLELKSPIKG